MTYNTKKPEGVLFTSSFACWGLGQLVDTGELDGELLGENAQCCQNGVYKFQKFSNVPLLRSNMF
jgi:hypothetical protein